MTLDDLERPAGVRGLSVMVAVMTIDALLTLSLRPTAVLDVFD